jgi:predicted nucleic acid-binding protein
VVCLVDTNVLLRLVDRDAPLHALSRAALRRLRDGGHALRTTSQNCMEFWNVATRPSTRNGLGLAPEKAHHLLRMLERLLPRLEDSPAVYPEWRRLVASLGVSGVQTHDAHLVATMIVHGATHVLTFNTTDFLRYAPEGIVGVDPAAVPLAPA